MASLFKQSIRRLILHPAISITVIAMLALGIGAATAIFSLFYQVLVQPLPVPEPERLVNIVHFGPDSSSPRESLSYPMFRDLQSGQEAFAGIAGFSPFTASVVLGEPPFRASASFVSGSYFEVLGLQPAVGRLIGRQDEPRIGEPPVVVLSHDFWQSRLGGDPGIVGRELNVNGQTLTVIGVTPEGFLGNRLAVRTHLFVPLTMRWALMPSSDLDTADNRRFNWLLSFARLRPGVSVEQAAANLDTVYGRVLREIEAPMRSSDEERRELVSQRLELVPGARGQGSIADGARSLTLLLGVTLLVLLLVCVNVANLLLVRGASRAGEMAVRESLGASRSRLVAELLIESSVPAVIGGALALPVASAMLAVVEPILPANLADGLALEIGSTAVWFAVLATVGAAVLFGLFPAMRTARTDPALAMKGQSAHALGGHAAPRVRSALVTMQIAFSLVLLVLAGLFAQSLLNVARIDLGVEIDTLVTFSVSPSANGYEPAEAAALHERIEEALAVQPGVVDAASAMVPLISGNELDAAFPLERADGGLEPVSANLNVVSASFFRTAGIPVLDGRGFTVADMAPGANVAIVNERFARRYGLRGNAVGTRIMLGERVEIVGVVADAAYGDVKGEAPPQLFIPRGSIDTAPVMASMPPTFYVRTAIDPEAMLRSIPGVVAEIDPTLPVDNLITMRRQAQEQVFVDRLLATLSGGFAALATLLAGTGLYSVIAYNVTARTRELGLRLALGAEASGLRWMIVKQVAAMAVIGVAIGVVGAVGTGRAAEALLYGLSGLEPGVIAAAAVVLAIVVLAATYAPARRASTVAPMQALRHE